MVQEKKPHTNPLDEGRSNI